MTQTLRTDAMVIGGGIVGTSAALALARHGMDVVLIEAQDPARIAAPTFDGRVTALAWSSGRMMQALGVWDDLEPHAQPITGIRISDARLDHPAALSVLDFLPREMDGQPFGWIAENRHIMAALTRALVRTPGARILAPAVVSGLEAGIDGVRADLADGRRVNARLAVAADGRASPCRRRAGIGVVGWDYPQHAIVTTVEHERGHGGIAVEHFLPAGPFAILPLPGHRSSLVWTEKAHLAPALAALGDDAFAAEVARRFGDHLGAVRPVGPRWTYPLAVHVARRFIDRRLALVGDAAHGIHPIAGQGANLGLRDVAALAELAVGASRLGLDPGSVDLLARYDRWRRTDTLMLAAVTDGLNRLFSNDLGPVRWLRDLGIATVDRITPLKRLFIGHARGTLGRIPRLLRGEAIG